MLEAYTGIIIRAVVIYIYVLVLLRLAGKRSIGDLSAIDFIAANLIGDLLDDAFWGEVPLAHAFMAVGITILVHISISYGVWRSSAFSRIVDPQPRTLVKNSRFSLEDLAKERIPKDDVYSLMHLKSTEYLKELQEATLETNGELSVNRLTGEKKAQKQDLEALKATVKRDARK